MRSFSRSDRVGGLIQQAVSEILRRSISDPRLEMTTISAVRMSPDLKVAKIYYTVPAGKKSRDEVAEGFKNATGFIKRSLASRVNLKYMPELKFFLDKSFDYGSHIDKLLASLHMDNERDITALDE